MVDDDPDRYDSATLRYWREDAESLAHYEKGLPQSLGRPVRFASIQMNTECMWQPAHRLHKVWTRSGGRADFGFHQIPPWRWKERRVSPRTRSHDPIFDIVVANDTKTSSVITAVGFETVAVWTALKGLPIGYKVPVLDCYVLRVHQTIPGEAQMLPLPDPIAVPPQGTVRYQLSLQAFRKALRANEALLRLCVAGSDVLWKSRFIYMGVY